MCPPRMVRIASSLKCTGDDIFQVEGAGRNAAQGCLLATSLNEVVIIPKSAPSIVQKIEDDAARWPVRVKAIGSGYWRVIGEVDDLIDVAKQIGQSWLCGLGFAQSISKNS